MKKEIIVVKDNGEKELFDPKKVKRALRRSGLSTKEADEILNHLYPKLRNGITTRKIYGIVYDTLKKLRPEVSHKYNLKRALKLLGPAGYEFEDFVSKLFEARGYKTETRQRLEGKCILHEIDVIAKKGKSNYMIECKFHNQPGIKCRSQTGLYVYSRFLDLQEGAKRGTCQKFTAPMIATNTKFSGDVIRYSQCMGMQLLGWKYPFRESLEILIDRTRCYPVSVIEMRRHALKKLLRNGIITVEDIPENAEELVERTGIRIGEAKKIVERAEYAKE